MANLGQVEVLALSDGLRTSRRRMLLAPLLAALPIGGPIVPAEALDPAETQITLANQYKWTAWTGGPPHSAEMTTLHGGLDQPVSTSC